VTVAPGHELGRGHAAIEILSRDAKPTVQRRTGCVDDRVIARCEVGPAEVGADREIAEETHGRSCRIGASEDTTDLMVGWSGATP